MSEQKTQLTYQQESVIELLKAHVQSQRDAIQTIENKAQQNFIIINIIVAIIATFNLGLGETNSIHQIINERPLLIVIFLVSALIAFLSIRTLTVRKHATYPMDPSHKNAKEWSNSDLEHYYDILVRSYLNIYDHNKEIVDSKGVMVKSAHRLLAMVIVLICLEVSGLLTLLPSWIETIFNQLPR